MGTVLQYLQLGLLSGAIPLQCLSSDSSQKRMVQGIMTLPTFDEAGVDSHRLMAWRRYHCCWRLGLWHNYNLQVTRVVQFLGPDVNTASSADMVKTIRGARLPRKLLHKNNRHTDDSCFSINWWRSGSKASFRTMQILILNRKHHFQKSFSKIISQIYIFPTFITNDKSRSICWCTPLCWWIIRNVPVLLIM